MKAQSFIVLVLFMLPAQAVEQIYVEAIFGNKVMLMVDGNRRTLAIGQTSREGVEVISVNNDAVVLEVNGKAQSYTLGSAISTNFTKRESIEEKVFADKRGMFETVGTINGQTVEFLVDTGATLIAMNKKQAKQLGIRYRLDGKPTGASTASGFVKGYKVKLKSVSLGRIKRANVDAMVIDGVHPGPILLGMSFLSDLKVEKAGNTLTVIQTR